MPKCKTEETRQAFCSKWKATMIAKYGEEGYKKHLQEIGHKGGTVVNTATPKGFAANPSLARLAGYKGGRISKRTH